MERQTSTRDFLLTGIPAAEEGKIFSSLGFQLWRKGISLKPRGLEGRGSAGWERRAEGLFWGRRLHCRGWQGAAHSPSHMAFLAAAPSPFLPMSLLPGAVLARSCFSVPMSPPCLCSQSPSHPLCAQLCPADSSWQQATAQGHLCVCRGQGAAQRSANENWDLSSFSRMEK